MSRFQKSILLIVQHKYFNMIHRVARTSPSMTLYFYYTFYYYHYISTASMSCAFMRYPILPHTFYCISCTIEKKSVRMIWASPPPYPFSPPHSLSLSLSLSLSVSLTNTHTQVFQLLGGTCSSFVCYVLPAMFAIRLQLFAHRPFMNAMTYLLAFMGALAGVLSTGVTLYGFAHPSRGGPSQCD